MTKVRLTQRGKNVRNIFLAAVATAALLFLNAQMTPNECINKDGLVKSTPECVKYITWGA